MRRFWQNNSLSIVLFGIFFCALVGMSVVGWRSANNEALGHNQSTESYSTYVTSGDFIEGVFENWESEFLQMFALVMLTIWLRQKGADDSKPIRGKTPQDTSSRLSIIGAGDWKKRRKAIGHTLYSHSLSLALISIFLLSFLLHAAGGAAATNDEAAMHNDPERYSTLTYITTAKFWYESLQNWQSEFLAVGSLLLLSIKLRERGSPESKPVGKRYDQQTGS